MKRVRFVICAVALAVLSYSAWELGIRRVAADDLRCCTYQVDCLSSQHCEPIFPECSETFRHICKPGKPGL